MNVNSILTLHCGVKVCMFIVNSIVTGLFLINKVVFVIVKKGKRECTKLTLARMWVAYKPRYVETLLEMPSKSRVVQQV